MTLVLLAAVLAADPPASTAPIGGGAVLSADARTVFAPAKGGGVEALDVATGKPLWLNKDAARVAGATAKFAVGWAADAKKSNTFRAVVIDAATGKTVVTSDLVAMPDWATTAPAHGRSFRVGSRDDGGKLVLAWQANAYYAGGARPTPEIEEAARKEATGVVGIDPATGKTAKVDRKPKDEDFGVFKNAAGGYEFAVEEEMPGLKPGAPMLTKVTLRAMKGKTVVWERALAGNPWSPPPP
ncbi:MAG TPA: hypothetical protein VM529_17535 [Gemmata sp.]|nr:hypothetical protein [Gemmata sp.]